MRIRALILVIIAGLFSGLTLAALTESNEARIRNLEEKQNHQDDFNAEGTKVHERQDARLDELEKTAHVSRIVGDSAIFVIPGIGALVFFAFGRYERRAHNEHVADRKAIESRDARIAKLEIAVEQLRIITNKEAT